LLALPIRAIRDWKAAFGELAFPQCRRNAQVGGSSEIDPFSVSFSE
jgi:hypothetical protein